MELKGVNDITKEKKVAVVETTTAGSSSSSKIVINFSTSESKNPKSTEKLPTHSEELVDKNPSMKNSSKMEVFRVGAEKYLSTSGLKNIKNSEELVKYLEEKPNKTNEEKKLLAQYQTISSGVVEPLVTYKELSKIENKENIPLLTADKYFSKTDEKYQKMSEEQKKQYCKQQILELADTVSTSSTPMEEKVIKATELFEVLNSSEMSVEDYKKLSKNEQVQLYRDHQLKKMKELKDLVPIETRQKWATMKPPMSADDKLKEYAKAFLNKYDSDFVAIKDDADKDKYIALQADSMISKFLPNWKETDPKIKEMMFSSIVGTIDALTEANMSFDEFQAKPQSKKVKFLNDSPNNVEISKMSSEEISLNLAIFDYAKKNKNTPTVKELKKFISENPDYENKDAMLNALEMRSRLFGKNAKVQGVETYKQRALEHGISAEEQIQKDFKDFGKLNANARTKRIRDMLLKADGDEALITQIKNLALENGFKEAKFNKILAKTETHKRMACNATLNNNPKAMKAAIDMGDKIGDIKSTQVIACSAPVLMEAKAGQALGVDLANENSKYLESYTTGVNQRSDAVAYSAAVVQSENMSPAGRAVYTQSAVKTASAEQQVEYGREFSKLDYPEVTEGLAAASKYVDKSVKNQYNSYVEQAIKNYPPEQQAKIRKALETGEISSETLEKTTVATNSNKTEKSAESTGNKADSQYHAATPTTSNPIKQQGVGSDIAKAPSATNSPSRASVTETPSVSSVTSNDRISGVNTVSEVSSSKVSSSTNLTDSEAQELTEKAQVVLDKIEDFIKTQKSSIEKYEAEKTEKAEHLSEEEIVKAIASGEISLADVKLSKEEVASLKDTITVLFEKNSASTAYKKLVSKFGKLEDVFLRAFAENADSSTLRSFAGDFRNNTDVILRLFKYSKDNSLLAFLPKDTIVALFGKEIDGSEISQSILWEIISEFEQKGETDKADKFRAFLKEGAGVQTTQVQTATNNTLGTSMNVAEDKSSGKTANANTNIQNQKLPKQSNKQAEATVPQPGSDSWYKDLNPKKSDVAAMLEEEKIESKKARIVEEQSNKNTDLHFAQKDYNMMDEDGFTSAPAFVSNSRRKGKKFDKKPYWLG